MTNNQRLACIREVPNYKDVDAYVSDLALSSIWGDSIGPVDEIRTIYIACTRSIKDIAAAAGMSNRKLAERFCVPYRTMEDWSAGKSSCPIYIRLMMQEILGI